MARRGSHLQKTGSPIETSRMFGSESPRARKKRPANTGDDVHGYAVDFVKAKIERYFEILSARLVDVVPMAIDMYLVQQFGHDAALRVANATHAFNDDEIIMLLQEDSELSRKRKEAQDVLDKLFQARETLDDFAATISNLQPF